MNNNHHRLLVKRFQGNTNSVDTHYLSAFSPHDLSENHENLYLPFFRKHYYYVCCSCGGMLCFDDFNGQIVVWNPTTKEFKPLPPSDVERPSGIGKIIFNGSGFGFDSKSHDYKFIRFMTHYYEEEEEDGITLYRGYTKQVELYSLNSDSWKEIPHPLSLNICYKGSAYVDGSYYWIAYVGSNNVFIHSFGFANETFSSLPLPTTKVSEDRMYNLIDFDGLLGVIVYPRYGIANCKSIELWVLNIERLWTKVFDVALYGVERPLGLWENGRLLFCEGLNNTNTEQRSQLLVYDRTTQELKKLNIYDYPKKMEIFSYVKSTVPIPKAKQITG